jgi:hypothetical protein
VYTCSSQGSVPSRNGGTRGNRGREGCAQSPAPSRACLPARAPSPPQQPPSPAANFLHVEREIKGYGAVYEVSPDGAKERSEHKEVLSMSLFPAAYHLLERDSAPGCGSSCLVPHQMAAALAPPLAAVPLHPAKRRCCSHSPHLRQREPRCGRWGPQMRDGCRSAGRASARRRRRRRRPRRCGK